MAMKKVVVLLFLAMLVVLTEHKAMAFDPFCVAKCTTSGITNPEDILKCLAGCGPCPLKCIIDFIANKSPPDVTGFALCLGGCLLPFGTISNELDTLKISTTVCNVGCSLDHCSKFLNDNDKFESCMKSCREKYCVGENIALEKA